MDRVKKLDVFYHDRLVGTMALYNGTLCAFEYSKEWLTEGFSISHFSYGNMERLAIVGETGMGGTAAHQAAHAQRF